MQCLRRLDLFEKATKQAWENLRIGLEGGNAWRLDYVLDSLDLQAATKYCIDSVPRPNVMVQGEGCVEVFQTSENEKSVDYVRTST